ncbi:hypothetical protein R3P38DRAFT_3230703 [Favolaschia claudopus]|uniref:Uncharacterized protein n=1 Tax=Favolaschia claudopus TaxID=2862362 RepID=A0AAV9ZML6_9AGAR
MAATREAFGDVIRLLVLPHLGKFVDADEPALTALSLDPKLVEARYALTRNCRGNLRGAIVDFQTVLGGVLELAPDNDSPPAGEVSDPPAATEHAGADYHDSGSLANPLSTSTPPPTSLTTTPPRTPPIPSTAPTAPPHAVLAAEPAGRIALFSMTMGISPYESSAVGMPPNVGVVGHAHGVSQPAVGMMGMMAVDNGIAEAEASVVGASAGVTEYLRRTQLTNLVSLYTS